MKRIVLGLSDGVDSAVAAHLLKEQGYEVLGLYLKNAGDRELEAARENAREAGIAFEALDAREALNEHVCQPFIDEYLRGRTPSPCPGCNRTVKLQALLDRADALGIKSVATGHYARKENGLLYMGAPECDQSYMLCLISPEQLNRLVLPLGAFAKSDVRKMAQRLGLSCAQRKDSRENCFIREMDYQTYIRRSRPESVGGPGEVYYDGCLFDSHEGIYAYTVGQRWRRDCNGRRLYVSRIDPAQNRIDLCLWEQLFTCKVDIANLNWLYGEPKESLLHGRIRVRHTRWETPECEIRIENGRAFVITAEPLRAPAKGQIAALYQEEKLIGGGTVESLAADYPLP